MRLSCPRSLCTMVWYDMMAQRTVVSCYDKAPLIGVVDDYVFIGYYL